MNSPDDPGGLTETLHGRHKEVAEVTPRGSFSCDGPALLAIQGRLHLTETLVISHEV